MYYIGNVIYFLEKEKLDQPAINVIVEKLESEVVNHTAGNSGLVPSGAVKEALGDMSEKFTRDFNDDRKHLNIVNNSGRIPES